MMHLGMRDIGHSNLGVALEWEVGLQLWGLKWCINNEPLISWQGLSGGCYPIRNFLASLTLRMTWF